MACIIKMSSDEFLDKFIKDFDYKKFNFLLISENVKTEKKYRNVYAIPSLIPPANVISEFIANGYTNDYVKKYLDYLSTPRVEAMITIMVKLAIVDNSNVIMLCSKAEDEFKYLDIICQYIEYAYGVNTYTFKKYKKNPDKCEDVDEKVKKKVVKILEKKLGEIKEIETAPNMTKAEKKQVEAAFKKMNKKEICKILKRCGIKHNPKDSKKDLRKTIIKAYHNGYLNNY